MKIMNPTSEVVASKIRVDGKWFGGVRPGETVEVFDEGAVRSLIKHGCVVVDVSERGGKGVVREKREKKAKKAVKSKKSKSKVKRGGR